VPAFITSEASRRAFSEASASLVYAVEAVALAASAAFCAKPN
jgi:hypothetical protein